MSIGGDINISHVMCIGPPCFPVFNNQYLSMEPVLAGDIVPFQRSNSADMEFAASASWSADCEWYFVVLPEGIALFSVYNKNGLLCQRRTALFIEACMTTGILSKTSARRKRPTPPEDSHGR